jgi:large subunit ribosomal protein L24
MAVKVNIKRGDQVMIIAGNERGEKGKVLFVDVEKYTALVEGKNIVSKHAKPTTENPQGGITKKEAPIHLSNLMMLDPKSGKPGRVGRKKDKKGQTVRYIKSTGEEIK